MSVRPLPGASYHTFDAFPYTDLEALDHFDTPPGYDISPSDEKDGFDHTFHRGCRCQQQQHLHHATRDSSSSSGRRQSRYRGPPVLLSLIVLCCLAFVASAFWQYSSNALPDVPRRHAPLADRLSSAFRTESQRAMVNEHYDSALQMMCVPAHSFFSFFLSFFCFCAWLRSLAFLFLLHFLKIPEFPTANCVGTYHLSVTENSNAQASGVMTVIQSTSAVLFCKPSHSSE